ncbi:MAG: hypothetical protein SOZ71_09785, partial [Clostridium sp.]|nr:hypothetical protein [Clostridium sp.]
MKLNIEFMKKYIIENIAGTEDDKGFIENLSNIALVKNEDIDKYENDVKCYIKQIIHYINNDKEKNGIKAIEDIFGFIKEFDFESGEGNFYLFVANVKIKAVALLCRMYLFIEKYHTHEEELLETERKNAFDATKKCISDYIENKDVKELLKSLTEKYNDNESNKIGYYLKNSSIDNKYELSEKIDEYTKSNYDFYEMSPECKKLAQIILNLINKDVNLKNINENEIGEIISTINLISDEKIENKIAEFEEEKNMSEFLQNEQRENRSLRYFLFDNRMKEVEFFGVENRFNWLWEQEEKVCLYRNVTKKNNNECLEKKKSYGYMKALMNYIVSHASGNSAIANSYSRNPIRDFYKYIDFPKKESPYKFNFEIKININNASENKFEVEFKINDEFEINKDVQAKFEFIENATTNSLKITNDDKEEEVSFYAYLKKDVNEYKNTKFCIEYCKENSIVPAESGRRLSKLNNYLHTWGIQSNFKLSKISDNDDEVITSTGYFSEGKVYNLNIGEIWAIMYKLYEYECEESNICEKDSKLKEKL